MMTKILGIGNALVDIMTRLDHDGHLEAFQLPKGSMTLVDEILALKVDRGTSHLEKIQSSGGSAANTIHGLARLGVETAFLGKVGRDELGNFFHEDLRVNGIDARLFFSEKNSGRAIALVSPDSERTFATYLGASIELGEDDLNDSHFEGYDLFHIEGYLVQNHKLIEKAVSLAKQNGLKVSLDMASYNVVAENLEFLKKLINRYVDIVFANEDEAKAFTGGEPHEAVNEIAGLCETAVVKMGAKGSLVKNGNMLHEIGIIEVKSVDTTGAGDLYASGFLFGLTKKYPLDKCGRIGALLSGNVIEVMGARMDGARWEKIKRVIGEMTSS